MIPTSASARVALVVMPFAHEYRPSLPISQLKAQLAGAGHEADVHYVNLEFAALVGPASYHGVSVGRPSYQDLVGEWIFAEGLAERGPDAFEAYRDEVLLRETIDKRSRPDPPFLADVERLARLAPSFLDSARDSRDWGAYDVAVFVVPFLEQTLTASLAMMARLKHRWPRLVTVLGGPGIEAEPAPALLRLYPQVDFACSGEWDHVLPLFISRLTNGGDGPLPPGLLSGAAVRALNAGELDRLFTMPTLSPPVHDLDALSLPDFDDFFDQFERAGSLRLRERPALVLETSRGCWWGAKHHCTFCGLNQGNMVYRQKSVDRALEEISTLTERYRGRFGVVEAQDTIMPANYVRELLPKLRDRAPGLGMFYEVKSNLRDDQLELFADAGCRIVQPGIESLSTPLLKAMDKGLTRLQNVAFLKGARRHGLTLIYNLLVGFPGEWRAEYAAQAELVPLLTHLQPPGWWGQVHLDRHSPYFFRPQDFAIRSMRPARAYHHVFPGAPAELLHHVAAIFEFDAPGRAQAGADAGDFLRRVRAWSNVDRLGISHLVEVRDGPVLTIIDTRPGLGPRRIRLEGPARQVYEAAAQITSLRVVARDLEMSETLVAGLLAELETLGLVIGEDDRWLALGLPPGERAFDLPEDAPEVAISTGRARDLALTGTGE